MKTRAFIDFAIGRMRANLQALGTAAQDSEQKSDVSGADLLPAVPVQRRLRGSRACR
jgi:hypothetical protein